ncbi:hypothetical protein MSWH1_2817 [Methanosarcina sp. WH1]|nr:hypothetical protein MSWH1_2817 [Methanosarcina sp. WH1]
MSCIGGTGISSGTVNPENPENTGQGSIILFSQDYSKNDSVPNNVFMAKLSGNKPYDRLYLAIYGILKTQVLFNDLSKGLKYKTTKVPGLFPCGLLSAVDAILGYGINRCMGNLMKSPDTHRFCEATSFPPIHYQGQQRQTGSLYICGLTPMVRCTYHISMDIKTDNPHSFVELNSPGSKLVIQETNNRITLKSYYESSSGGIGSETIFMGNATEKLDFEIMFDGCGKTNTIFAKDGKYITTPFYNSERRQLPYIDFSNGYLKFTSFLAGKGRDFDVNIYRISQRADRKFITAIGDNALVPFGLDGPHVRNTTEKGIRYLNSKNNRGTIWFDIELLEQCSESDIEYLRNLVVNNSWDTGVHYSEELNSLSYEQACKVMNEGYSYVYEKIGKKPTTWCSMRNRDNVTHAIYAYENLGMFWRNGDSGIHAERNVGNLGDETWAWWEPASRAGMVYPAFTHELDLEPAIKYSISRSKFHNWVDNYNSNKMTIVSFYEYNQISRNTYDASFDILKYTENFFMFNAHTKGFDALINVNINAGENTRVCDNTLEQFLSYKLEQDKSITFRVKNNHTYSVYLDSVNKECDGPVS